MEIKKGQIYQDSLGYYYKIVSHVNADGKHLVKVCCQSHCFYATPKRISTWKVVKSS